MEYKDTPNLLLEALAYLGRKASGNTWENIEKKIKDRKISTTDSFHITLIKIKELTNNLDKEYFIDEETLQKFFKNIEGFQFNTIGSHSIAFLIFYSVLEEFNGNFNELIHSMDNFTHPRIAYNIAETLDILDGKSASRSLSDKEFMDGVLSLSIPAESKIAIFDIYSNYNEYLKKISFYLGNIIDILAKKISSLSDITSSFNDELTNTSCEDFLHKTSQLKLLEKTEYHIQPFIFGMDTNITSPYINKSINIYCGILRKELLDMLNNKSSDIDDLYTAYNLFGDRTRFDIICYIRNHSAYAQELSKHFNLSRNTIHHHMSKLINSGFVRCTADGNRVYYSLNTETFENLINKQKSLFCSE